nr:DegT/DnrJ/EryC1/StrS family aminotransferase [Lachnospiraceae bacterium]
RDWGRDCSCPSGVDNSCGHRYDGQYGQLPEGYDHKYVYSHFGYNLKATDMQAAVGCAQLKKFPGFVKKRRENFDRLYQGLKDLDEVFILPEAEKNSKPSWFGFMLTVREGFSRNDIVKYIEDNKVQTRMLFSGNIIKHPCFDEIRGDDSRYRVVGELKNTDRIMRDTFWTGLYPGMDEKRIDRMIRVIRQAVDNSR